MSAKAKQPGTRGVFRAHPGVSSAAFKDDAGNVNQRFHVVDDGWLAEESALCGEWRFISRLAAIAFNRAEKGGLFAADIRASASANLNVALQFAAKNVFA